MNFFAYPDIAKIQYDRSRGDCGRIVGENPKRFGLRQFVRRVEALAAALPIDSNASTSPLISCGS